MRLTGGFKRNFEKNFGFFSSFGYCKRILDTLKTFCYFWALDMAPTWAGPGLLFISHHQTRRENSFSRETLSCNSIFFLKLLNKWIVKVICMKGKQAKNFKNRKIWRVLTISMIMHHWVLIIGWNMFWGHLRMNWKRMPGFKELILKSHLQWKLNPMDTKLVTNTSNFVKQFLRTMFKWFNEQKGSV